MAHQEESPFCLVSLDTQGEWNRPLLENAAAISGSECIFTSSDNNRTGLISGAKSFDEVLQDFRNVIACEIVRDSVDIFNFPAPRERTAVLVGHEQTGIPRSVLKKADSIVSIPMVGAGMSSVNVAVSAAITLYVLSKDIGRMKKVKSRLAHRDVDILINAPEDPHELGSLLRSIWAFGWRRVFLNDPIVSGFPVIRTQYSTVVLQQENLKIRLSFYQSKSWILLFTTRFLYVMKLVKASDYRASRYQMFVIFWSYMEKNARDFICLSQPNGCLLIM